MTSKPATCPNTNGSVLPAVFMTLLGAAFLFVALFDWQQQNWFQKNGLSAVATIVDIRQEHDSANDMTTTRYDLKVTHPNLGPGQFAVNKINNSDLATGTSVTIGAKVNVLLHPKKMTGRMTEHTGWMRPAVIGAVGTPFVFAGLFGALYRRRVIRWVEHDPTALEHSWRG